MSKPNNRVKVFSGVGAETWEISAQYEKNDLTIIGLTTGTLIARVKSLGSTAFETAINGRLNLEYHLTMSICDVQLQELEFTVTPEAAYTVKLKQTNGNTES